jgi:hypothetical protein
VLGRNITHRTRDPTMTIFISTMNILRSWNSVQTSGHRTRNSNRQLELGLTGYLGGTRPGLAFDIISDATARYMYNGLYTPKFPFIHVMRFQTVFDYFTKRFDKPTLRSLRERLGLVSTRNGDSTTWAAAHTIKTPDDTRRTHNGVGDKPIYQRFERKKPVSIFEV